MTKDPKLVQKVLVVGDSNGGKSALIKQFVDKKFTATGVLDISIKEIVINNNLITMQFWDTAGQERFRAVNAAYYRGAHCCVLVFDVTNRHSFKNLGSWRDEFLIHLGVENPKDFPFVVLGNKVDLANREVSRQEAEQWCKIHSIPYYETSAKDGTGVSDAFMTLAQKAFETKAKDSTNSFALKASKGPRQHRQPRQPETFCCSNNNIHFNFEKFW